MKEIEREDGNLQREGLEALMQRMEQKGLQCKKKK